jgi:hypothetical protein
LVTVFDPDTTSEAKELDLAVDNLAFDDGRRFVGGDGGRRAQETK